MVSQPWAFQLSSRHDHSNSVSAVTISDARQDLVKWLLMITSVATFTPITPVRYFMRLQCAASQAFKETDKLRVTAMLRETQEQLRFSMSMIQTCRKFERRSRIQRILGRCQSGPRVCVRFRVMFKSANSPLFSCGEH